ncbi:hypothetical protein RRG08_012048 [Elysia crispata]|uniref:Uncharacterized protein n=1 Tax=Elysia crispata TaxID=231223 RepID=A0AAE0XWM6_9GAST|nr:hypothetical protein RRG08_012048 [Elysia crispata]
MLMCAITRDPCGSHSASPSSAPHKPVPDLDTRFTRIRPGGKQLEPGVDTTYNSSFQLSARSSCRRKLFNCHNIQNLPELFVMKAVLAIIVPVALLLLLHAAPEQQTGTTPLTSPFSSCRTAVDSIEVNLYHQNMVSTEEDSNLDSVKDSVKTKHKTPNSLYWVGGVGG